VACQRPAERAAAAATPSPAASPAVAHSGGPAEAPLQPGTSRPTPSRAQAPVAATPHGAPHAQATAEPAATAPPEPEPTSVPTPKPKVVPSGTALAIVLEQELSTKTARPEDPVVASLADDVRVDGEVLLPKGAEVHGSVVSSVRSGRTQGRAHIVVAFTEVRVNSRSYPIEATGFDVTAGSSKGKDAKIAGGAAAAGVLIGAIAGGGSGAVKGGLIGGAAGGAAVLATRGVEVELKAGSEYKIELKKSLRVR
jgi:type IV secretory pathway VirB10-like protein